MSGIDNFLNKNQQTNWFLNQQETSPVADAVPPSANIPSEPDSSAVSVPNNTLLRDEFVRVKAENGVVGKFYNFLKNVTGVGLGSKKVENYIDKFEKGEITEEQVRDKVSEYKVSRENAVQSTGDLAAAAMSITAFYKLNNAAKKLRAQYEIGALPSFLKLTKDIADETKEGAKETKFGKSVKNFESIIKSKGKTAAFIIPAVALIGGLTKYWALKFERVGSNEFKTDKNLPKSEKRKQKIAKNKARHNQNFKNFMTGMAAGALAPVTALVGGIVGVPAYLASVTGIRYASSKNDGKKKSGSDFVKTLKDNALLNTAIAAAIAVPAFKRANFSKVLGENLEKVVTKLKGKNLKAPDLPASKSAYQEIEDILLNSEAIKTIIENKSFLSMDDVIKKLTEENILAVKMLQIQNGSEISRVLKEDCPPTRDLAQAQNVINNLWGSAEYTISKLLGVGTVAETYLAKDKSGKEVCIKILKDGITADKIKADKEKLIKLVTEGKPIESLSEDKKYLIKNIEDLAEGIGKEVDFKNEMDAAKELVKHSKVANVVKPIAAKDGIYVMERAEGISVKTLAGYYQCEHSLLVARKDGDEAWVKELEERMKKIKSRSPEFADFDMTDAQIKKLLTNYIDLFTEQFSRLDKNGKVIHADIHPGNIFINLEALKTGKGKLFTLIDTGNVIRLSKEQTKASLRIIPFIKNGNTTDLSKIVLDGAVLPKGMTEADALSKVKADLDKFFFDGETKIEKMNIDTFYTLSDNILRKYGIVPQNTQLNLYKAKKSANDSLKDLINTLFGKKYGNKLMLDMSQSEQVSTGAKIGMDIANIMTKLKTAQSWQETKNLFQMDLKEAWNFLRNKNMLKTNSEEYLTYIMKQNMAAN